MGMKDQVRLDRFLAEEGIGSRADVKKMIRAGRVMVNRERARQGDRKIDPEEDEVLADGKRVRRNSALTLMLNKPAGVVSATKDENERTVIDLIGEPWAKRLFPVGRLDKDTEGLLLLTADGAMSHRLLSPGKHVEKTYFAVVSGAPDPELAEQFREGIEIGEKRKTLPAGLRFLSGNEPADEALTPEDLARCGEGECCVIVSITEGKYHQIKRMFGAAGREVHYLKRIAMGGLRLDPALPSGRYRPLTDEEQKRLCPETDADS